LYKFNYPIKLDDDDDDDIYLWFIKFCFLQLGNLVLITIIICAIFWVLQNENLNMTFVFFLVWFNW